MYDSIKLGMRHTDDVAFVMEQIENNSIILPKKHGRLIDADVLKSKMGDLAGFGILGRCFDDEPTVIDATKEKGAE